MVGFETGIGDVDVRTRLFYAWAEHIIFTMLHTQGVDPGKNFLSPPLSVDFRRAVAAQAVGINLHRHRTSLKNLRSFSKVAGKNSLENLRYAMWVRFYSPDRQYNLSDEKIHHIIDLTIDFVVDRIMNPMKGLHRRNSLRFYRQQARLIPCHP